MDKSRDFVRPLKNSEGNFVFTPDQLKEFVEILKQETETEVREKLIRMTQEYFLHELKKD